MGSCSPACTPPGTVSSLPSQMALHFWGALSILVEAELFPLLRAFPFASFASLALIATVSPPDFLLVDSLSLSFAILLFLLLACCQVYSPLPPCLPHSKPSRPFHPPCPEPLLHSAMGAHGFVRSILAPWSRDPHGATWYRKCEGTGETPSINIPHPEHWGTVSQNGYTV